MPQKGMECCRLLLDHLTWIEHQFLSGIRDSRKPRSLWGTMGGVGGIRKSIHHSWLAKGLGFGLLCWGFKGIQEEIRSEEASTLQIGSETFPAVHNSILVTDYLRNIGIKTVPQPPYSPDLAACDFWLFPKNLLLWDNWGDERSYDEGHWHAHTRGLLWGFPEVVWMV